MIFRLWASVKEVILESIHDLVFLVCGVMRKLGGVSYC